MKIIKKGINLQYSKIIRRGIAICHCCPFGYYIYFFLFHTAQTLQFITTGHEKLSPNLAHSLDLHDFTRTGQCD